MVAPAIAIPIAIEKIAEGVVALLAAVLGVGVIVENEDRKRREQGTPVPPVSIPRTEAPTKTEEKKKCPDCPPECQGTKRPQNTKGWPQISIDYQEQICKMGVGPGYINEWEYNGVSFDGFDASQCLLKEAKAKYDQFFTDTGEVQEWWKPSADNMFKEAERQATAAQPRPPVQLKWYFMQPISYRHFSSLIRATYPDVEVIHQP